MCIPVILLTLIFEVLAEVNIPSGGSKKLFEANEQSRKVFRGEIDEKAPGVDYRNGALEPQLRGGSTYPLDLYPSADGSYSTIYHGGGSGYHETSYHPTGYGNWEDDSSEKWHGLSASSVFQMSLTALAFLAFGGFLLNLVVMAIKDNKNNSGGMTTMSPDTLVLVPLKRPKTKGEIRKSKKRIPMATKKTDEVTSGKEIVGYEDAFEDLFRELVEAWEKWDSQNTSLN